MLAADLLGPSCSVFIMWERGEEVLLGEVKWSVWVHIE